MSGLNYPYVFECNGCREHVKITRSDALEACADPDSVAAVTEVLHQTYRWRHDRHDLYCGECTPEGMAAG